MYVQLISFSDQSFFYFSLFFLFFIRINLFVGILTHVNVFHNIILFELPAFFCIQERPISVVQNAWVATLLQGIVVNEIFINCLSLS